MFKEKGVVIGAIVTILVLLGGILIFSKKSSSTSKPTVYSNALLTPDSAYVTGGIKDGKYLPKNTSANVTVVEFGDYQCPACGAYHPLVSKLLTDEAGKINFVFRNFPLSQHANGFLSSQAVEAAGLQGKFWEMHDKVYESQSDWSDSKDPKSIFISYAKALGMDETKYSKDLDSSDIKSKINKDSADGNAVGISGTPTFFVNGVKLTSLPRSYEELKSEIDNAVNQVPSASSSPTSAYHIHFDLKIFLNGKAVDLSLAKYQESKTNTLDPDIHLHNRNGKVVHVHKEGATLGQLLSSLKITLPQGTLAYVNGKKITDILNYVPQDLDRIIIGSSNMNLVSNDACIYSLKCSDRGTPPPEDCVGGLGTGCIED